MQKLFGIPIDDLLYGLLAALAAGLLVLVFQAMRNPVLFKTGVRNITRRPVQTSLIVLGLMLATLLFSAALVTGDTMSYSVKKSAIEGLGPVDVVVQTKGKVTRGNGFIGRIRTQAKDTYFGKDKYEKVRDALSGKGYADGVTPIISEQTPALSPKNQQNVPAMTVLGVANDYARQIARLSGKNGELKVTDLKKSEIYLNDEAAEKLDVKIGDEVQLFMAVRPISVKVTGVFEEGGHPSSGPVLVMSASRMQELVSRKDKFNSVLISGKGDEIEGVKKTNAILDELKPVLTGGGLEAKEVKKDTLEDAEKAAASFTSVFIIFGQFSMIAGIMLIFLIFVMLAAERKTELGVMRALGCQRRDILKIFTFEGTVYAVLSAAIGAVLGLGVGWGMVRILARAFGQIEDLKLIFHVEPKSFAIAYAMGVITTFLVVFFSAWRTGHINIVRAIRDLPEPKKAGRSVKWLILSLALLLFGALLTSSGLNAKQLSPFMIGTSFIIVGVPLSARYLRLPDRAAFTLAGVGLLVWWLLPADIFQKLLNLPDMKSGIEMFFVSGVSIVAGAIWAVMYNSDVLLSIVVAIFGRFKGLPPMLRIAVNYPMKNRFRTGMALAMFALIIFTMVFMGTIILGVGSIYNDIDGLSGGFQIQGVTGYSNPVRGVWKTLDEKGKNTGPKDFKAIVSFSMAGVEMRQTGAKKKWVEYPLQGMDAGYTDNTNYTFKLRAAGYASDRAVWKALQEKPGLAVVHANIVPAKTDYNVGDEPPDFMLGGFYRDDKKLPETYIEVRDSATGKTSKLKVIGVIEDMAVGVYNGVFTSQKTIDEILPAPVPAVTYWFKVKPGVDVREASKALTKTFYENGMSTTNLEENIKKMMQVNVMMNRLIQGFMGLGLVVGIAALGVIAARSVVERRQQIGMLRAIGFRRGMVQNTFILESSFVAVLGIVIGSALGLILSYNSMPEFEKQIPGMTFMLPWGSVLVVAVIAYGASLLTTYLPARQASRVYPAEALRYE